MSTERSAVLIYGWTGSRKSVGEILKPFADENNIETDVEDIGYEIIEDNAHLLNNLIQKMQKQTGYNFEWVQGESNYEGGEYYFGIQTDYISDLSFEQFLSIMQSMKDILEANFKDIYLSESPKFSNVISWF